MQEITQKQFMEAYKDIAPSILKDITSKFEDNIPDNGANRLFITSSFEYHSKHHYIGVDMIGIRPTPYIVVASVCKVFTSEKPITKEEVHEYEKTLDE